MAGNTVDMFLAAVEGACIEQCEVFAKDAHVDATVPNWRYEIKGDVAIRAEFSGWYADAGTFEELRRTPLPDGEMVEFTLSWMQGGVPHAAHQVHIIATDSNQRIASDRVWCGGRWPASLLAEMEEAANANG